MYYNFFFSYTERALGKKTLNVFLNVWGGVQQKQHQKGQ